MRCSLLTLSSYLDRELAPERSAEVDAHLVGCVRCQTGLGYLREEAHRVRTLSRVTVPDDGAHALLTTVGLLAEDEALPGEPRWHAPITQLEQGLPPWLQDRGGRTLPWAPRNPAAHQPVPAPVIAPQLVPPPPPPPPVQTAPPVVDEDPFTMTMNFDSPAGRPAVEEDIEPSAEPQVTHHDFEVEVPGTAQSPAAPIEDLQEPEPPVVTAAQGPPPMPVALPPRSPVGGIVARMRDALAVRMALLRGEGALDPDIQIVSGAGAPARRRQPAGPLPESEAEFEEVELPSQPQPQPQPQPVAVGAVAESFEPMEFEPMDAIGDEELDIPDRWLNEPQRAEAAGRPAVLPVPIRPPAPVAPSHEPQPEPHDIDDSPGAPPPGRHMRSVLGGTGRPSWLSLEPIRQAMRDVSRSREPGVAIAGRDSRLWVFGGAVLIILLVGVLTGKSVSTPSSSNTAAHSHGTATTPVQQVPTAAPTTIATPTAAPTPPPAAVLPALTGAHTLGSGATQYGVNGIRYGVHPGDYRIVVDLGDTTGAGGAPTVTLGIGPGGTALYVEFSSVTPSGQPETPSAGGVVTGATLLLPSPAGKTVYRFSLQHSATVSAYYLFNATRLVIDLT